MHSQRSFQESSLQSIKCVQLSGQVIPHDLDSIGGDRCDLKVEESESCREGQLPRPRDRTESHLGLLDPLGDVLSERCSRSRESDAEIPEDGDRLDGLAVHPQRVLSSRDAAAPELDKDIISKDYYK